MNRRVTLNPAKIWSALGYHPHSGQVEIHRSSARMKVIAAGRRFGKSEIGAAELDLEARRTRYLLSQLEDSGKRREFWLVGPEYTDSEKEFRKHYDRLKRAGAPFDKPGTYYDPHAGDLQLSMYKGKYLVLGKSAKHPERLVGEGINGCVMCEAAKLKEITWTKFVRPMLADYRGWAIFSSTPEGKNYFYELWMRGQSAMYSEWASWRRQAWLNPYVYPMGGSDRGVRALRKIVERGVPFDLEVMCGKLRLDPELASEVLDLSEETFNQEIAADFTEFAGRVFKLFDEEKHVRDLDYNPAWPTYAAVDYGFTNPFVWLRIQEDPLTKTIYVIDELYQPGLTIDDAAREIDRRGIASGVSIFYPDPASPESTLALERHLKIPAGGHTGGELQTRLRYIREALKDRNQHLPEDDPDRHPKLLIARRCPNMIREMNDYRYPRTRSELQETNERELPLKKDDHTPEALGRFYVGRYGIPEAVAEPTGTTAVKKAKIAR